MCREVAKISALSSKHLEKYEYLFQDIKRLFVLAYVVTAGANAHEEVGIKYNKKYFLPREKINNYIVLTDGRNSYD